MSRFLALDPDARGLFVLAGTVTKAGPQVEHAFALPAGPDDARPLTPAGMAALGVKLKDALKQAGIAPAPVLLVLGRDRVIFKDVNYPPSSPADEPAIVRGQAGRDLVEALGDVLMDYTPLPRRATSLNAESDPLRQAQVVIVRKDVVVGARELCDAAGLRLAGVTPRPYALAASLPESPTGGVQAVASVWDGGGEFVVCRGLEVLYARTLSPLAGQSDAALAGELKRNLTVYAGQRGAAAVEVLYVAEVAVHGAAGRLADLLPLPVRPLDPCAGSLTTAGVADELRGRFAAPLGLLWLRGHGPVLPINFTVPRQPKAAPTQVRFKALVGGLVAAAVVGLLGVVGFLELQKADDRIAGLQSQKADLDAELKRSELDMKRLAAVDEFESRQVVWLDELYDLADRVPDVSKVSVTLFDGDPALAAPKLAPRPGQPAPDPKLAKLAPVARLKISLRGADDKAFQRAYDGFQADKFYADTKKTIQGDAGGKGQLFELQTNVLHRPPADYLRRLGVTFPTRTAPPVDADPDAPPAGDDELPGGN